LLYEFIRDGQFLDLNFVRHSKTTSPLLPHILITLQHIEAVRRKWLHFSKS
jgi:hypothetical protein